MPDPIFVPGSLGSITLNAVPLVNGFVSALNLSRAGLSKRPIGAAWGFALGGQRSGAFSASGGVSAAEQAGLQALFASDVAIPFSIQIGDGAGATDSGLYTGNCVVTSFNITVNGDGEWDWSLDAITTGAVAFAPATP